MRCLKILRNLLRLLSRFLRICFAGDNTAWLLQMPCRILREILWYICIYILWDCLWVFCGKVVNNSCAKMCLGFLLTSRTLENCRHWLFIIVPYFCVFGLMYYFSARWFWPTKLNCVPINDPENSIRMKETGE